VAESRAQLPFDMKEIVEFNPRMLTACQSTRWQQEYNVAMMCVRDAHISLASLFVRVQCAVSLVLVKSLLLRSARSPSPSLSTSSSTSSLSSFHARSVCYDASVAPRRRSRVLPILIGFFMSTHDASPSD
jgi:hypothetical protein